MFCIPFLFDIFFFLNKHHGIYLNKNQPEKKNNNKREKRFSNNMKTKKKTFTRIYFKRGYKTSNLYS